jgi:hypothetical protein
MGGNARRPATAVQFRVVQRRNTIEHLRRAVSSGISPAVKSMGHSCGQNGENAYYGRKAARAVCHLGLPYSPAALYIKIYKTCNLIFKIDLEQRHDNDIYRENHVSVKDR